MMMHSTQVSKQGLRLLIVGLILILLNIISHRLHHRFDLSTEKRYSLSTPTKQLLKNLREPVVIEIYLKGKLPAGFQRLAESARDILNEFKEYGGRNVRFQFINPMEGVADEDKRKVYESLAAKGINPVNLKIQQDDDNGYAEKIIFPSARVMYNQKEVAVNLLESHISMKPTEKLNYAESMLEYKFASSIKQLLVPDKKHIAWLVGHGELLGDNTIDILTTLEKYYKVDTLDLTRNIEIGPYYDAILIAKPQQAFDDKNKFKIDQYVMHGGKILWCLDVMGFTMDSLVNSSAGIAMDMGLNLDDLLFRYGVRINPDLVEDYLQANPIPVTVGMIGNNPDIRLLPWLYNPFAISTSKQSIVNNLDAVMFLMASSIDTIAAPGIKKEILLHSSPRSRRMPAPVRISLSNLKFAPQAEMYKEKNIPFAVLLEGKFSSIYANRLDPNFIRVYEDSLKKNFKAEADKEGRMIVVSDGDIVTNDFIKSRGPLECGYYKYTEQQFANKTFILNSLEYLTDDYRILEARNKNLTLRLLDDDRIKKEKVIWQLLNTVVPVLLILAFGSAFFFFRKRKYEGLQSVQPKD